MVLVSGFYWQRWW